MTTRCPPRRSPSFLLLLAALGLALGACGASDQPEGGGGSGGEEIDAAGGGAGGGGEADASSQARGGDRAGLPDASEGPDDELGDASDGAPEDDVHGVEWVDTIPDRVDVCNWFDACGGDDLEDAGPEAPDAGAGGGGGGAADADAGASAAADAGDAVGEAPDVALEDVELLPDVMDGQSDGGTAQLDAVDGGGGADTVFSNCEELGIADQWAGTFEGVIDYDVDSGGLVTPERGKLSIGGDLTFGIDCIDSKLVVTGTLEGFATIASQGDFPFSIELGGYYNPATGHIDTSLGDGVVSIYGLIEVYFIGALSGDLTPEGSFDGDWEAESTGTNQAFVTGTAEGDGTWNASPAP